MSALTMKTSPHTDMHHALARNGEHALCRRNLKPATWERREHPTAELETRSATYSQPGDTFKRSCSRTRVNCLPCRRKLDQEVAVAHETAEQWNAALPVMAKRDNRPVQARGLQDIVLAQGMVGAGLLVVLDVPEGSKQAEQYVLSATGRRVSGLDKTRAEV